MDFSYDWLLAQIRHDLNKYFLFLIAYFPCFGPNKKNLKCRNKLNFIMATCRSFRPPPYPHVKNVPALVSHDLMEGKRHTNKPKAMEDNDATLPNHLGLDGVLTIHVVILSSYVRVPTRNGTWLNSHLLHSTKDQFPVFLVVVVVMMIVVLYNGGGARSSSSGSCGCWNFVVLVDTVHSG